MAYPIRRKPARRSSDYIDFARTVARNTGSGYESRRSLADEFDREASVGRERNGGFMRSGDKSRLRASARQIRKDASLRGNDYQYGTREEVKAQHNARYRNIRRSFGMSAG